MDQCRHRGFQVRVKIRMPDQVLPARRGRRAVVAGDGQAPGIFGQSCVDADGAAGVLLEPDDAPAWAEAIRQLLEDEAERDRLIELGLRQVRGFTWRKTAEETLAVYERCLA